MKTIRPQKSCKVKHLSHNHLDVTEVWQYDKYLVLNDSLAEDYLAEIKMTTWLKMKFHTQNRIQAKYPIEVQN